MTDRYFEQEPGQLRQFLEFIEEDLENVRRVIDFCEENDLDVKYKIHDKAETCEESAENTGISMDQIVKTLVFKTGEGFVAVLCPGDKRVSEEKLEKVTGGEVRMAKPDEVEENTGYVIGGVSPFDLDIAVYMEESILEHDKVKPAAGSRVVGLEIDPEELKSSLDPNIVEVRE